MTSVAARVDLPSRVLASRIAGWRWVIGWWGASLLPAIVTVDWLLARARGWSGAGEGPWGKLAWPAVAMLALLQLLAASGVVRRWLARRAAQLWLMSMAALVGLVIAEVALRWSRDWAPFHGRPPGARYEFAPDFVLLPGVQGTASESINSWGLRGSEPPPRSAAYRIVCLGGGTTEGCYLDDGETWPAQLAQCWPDAQRPVWIASAAVCDFDSGHHLRWLESSPLVSEVDCVVVLVGANDLVRDVLGIDNGWPPPPKLLQLNSCELLKQIWNVRLGRGLVIDREGRRLVQSRRGREIPAPASPWQPDKLLDAYGQRLARLCAAAKRRGVRLVCVTEPTLWDDYLSGEADKRMWIARTDPEPRPWELLRRGPMRELMDLYNLKLLEVCHENDVEVVDAAAAMSGTEPFFYDDYHPNEQGAAVLAKILADHFAAPPPAPTAVP
ncbi:MAG: SGNH/GDSL hydrolase family protein [Pirellulales bacterium]